MPDKPKCLAPVGDRPFLELQLRTLTRQGFNHFVLSLGHMATMVRQAAQGFEVDALIECVVEELPLGTGGAVLHAMRESGLEEAAVVNGDTFIEADLSPMLGPLNRADGEQFRIGTIVVEDRSRYGGVQATDGRVQRIEEKGFSGPGSINAGLYRLCTDAFLGFSPGTAFSMETAVMPTLLRRRALYAASLVGEFIDIGIPHDYRRFCALQGV